MTEEKSLGGTKQNITTFSPLADLAPMTKNQVMDIAMDLGKILLKSGAETSRGRYHDALLPQLRIL